MKQNQRVRRTPEQAIEEILTAANDLFTENGEEPVTVGAIMKRTGMTRSTFYHYFSNLEEICNGLLNRLESRIIESVDGWLDSDGGEDPKQETKNQIMGMFEIINTNKLPTAATTQMIMHSPLYYQQWQMRIINYFAERTAIFIERQIAAGRSQVKDPHRVAKALLHMNSSVVTVCMMEENAEEFFLMASVLADVWNATIYGTPSDQV